MLSKKNKISKMNIYFLYDLIYKKFQKMKSNLQWQKDEWLSGTGGVGGKMRTSRREDYNEAQGNFQELWYVHYLDNCDGFIDIYIC